MSLSSAVSESSPRGFLRGLVLLPAGFQASKELCGFFLGCRALQDHLGLPGALGHLVGEGLCVAVHLPGVTVDGGGDVQDVELGDLVLVDHHEHGILVAFLAEDDDILKGKEVMKFLAWNVNYLSGVRTNFEFRFFRW